jgi:hypothetical protein
MARPGAWASCSWLGSSVISESIEFGFEGPRGIIEGSPQHRSR